MRDRVSGSKKKKEAFIFVHGYNTTFDDSVRRTAQMAFDLDFDGAPIAYIWPAGDALWKYAIAEGNVEWTFRRLQEFLEEVAKNSGAERIHLIAHSMGNRVLLNALNGLTVAANKPFHQIVLAAPDIDTEVFTQIEQKIVSTADRVTIYASSGDFALKSSKKFHAYKRLGQAGEDIFASKYTDTVGISTVDDTTIGHSYYGDNVQVLSDLALILKQNHAPNLRPVWCKNC